MWHARYNLHPVTILWVYGLIHCPFSTSSEGSPTLYFINKRTANHDFNMKTKDFDSLEKRVYFWVFTGEQKKNYPQCNLDIYRGRSKWYWGLKLTCPIYSNFGSPNKTCKKLHIPNVSVFIWCCWSCSPPVAECALAGFCTVAFTWSWKLALSFLWIRLT